MQLFLDRINPSEIGFTFHGVNIPRGKHFTPMEYELQNHSIGQAGQAEFTERNLVALASPWGNIF